MVFGTGVLLTALSGCGQPWSSDSDSGRLQDGIDELVSVRGPDGRAPTHVRVLGCDDDAEMPMAIARFDHDGPDDPRDADAANAELKELAGWYHARWGDLGWQIEDREFGSALKEVDGKRMRASLDGVTPTAYSVTVVRDGAGLCD